MNYFDTIYLFIFLPVAMLIYQLTKRKFRWITLLVLSCFVYYTMSEKLIIVFAATSFFTYLIARIIQNRNDNGKKSKGFLILGIVGLFLTLIIFKYTGFLEQNLNVILAKLKVKQLPDVGNIIMPMGISFYTLEAVGYITDVYWKKIKAEKNPLKVMLFLGFFPQIMEGPIALYSQTSSKLFEGNPITADNISQGGIRIFIGLFKKIVIADRLSMMVSRLYKNPLQYHGAMIAGAAIVYTIQLYLEFSGTMDVVVYQRTSNSHSFQRMHLNSGEDGIFLLESGLELISFIQCPFLKWLENGIKKQRKNMESMSQNSGLQQCVCFLYG